MLGMQKTWSARDELILRETFPGSSHTNSKIYIHVQPFFTATVIFEKCGVGIVRSGVHWSIYLHLNCYCLTLVTYYSAFSWNSGQDHSGSTVLLSGHPKLLIKKAILVNFGIKKIENTFHASTEIPCNISNTLHGKLVEKGLL